MDLVAVLADTNFTGGEFLLYILGPLVLGGGFYFVVARPLRRQFEEDQMLDDPEHRDG